jgi:hypothetical protein
VRKHPKCGVPNHPQNFAVPRKLKFYSSTGVQSKNNVYHIVDKVQNSYENTLNFDLIDNVVYVVFALYSRVGGIVQFIEMHKIR